MRLALLVPAPFTAVSGGYAYDRRMVAGLRAAGHEVRVIELGGRHPLPDDAAKQAAAEAVAMLDGARPILDGLGLPAFAEVAEDLLAADPVGLIHHPTALEAGFPDADRDALRETEKKLFPRLRRVIVTSRATANNLISDFGVPGEHIAVVEPGTDPTPRSSGSGGHGVHVISIGTLVPRKGHDVLIRALARLSDLAWRLTIAGAPGRDRGHAEQLITLAEDLGVARRVTFAGELVDAALNQLWESADIFALATRWEGYGMVVAEALRHGLPVAVTRGGAAADLVPPDAGVTSAVDDEAAFSKALRRLIFDAELRRTFADNAWRAGQKLPDWATQARLFAAALR